MTLFVDKLPGSLSILNFVWTVYEGDDDSESLPTIYKGPPTMQGQIDQSIRFIGGHPNDFADWLPKGASPDR